MSESAQHEQAKQAALEAFRAAGCLMRKTEFRAGDGVRTDAFAVRPARGDDAPEAVIAVEVQLSPQSAEETLRRDAALKAALEERFPGVPQVRLWALSKASDDLRPDPEFWPLDLRDVDPKGEDPVGAVRQAAKLLAEGKVAFRPERIEDAPCSPIPASVTCPCPDCRNEPPVIVLSGLLVRADLVQPGADAMVYAPPLMSSADQTLAVDRCLAEVDRRVRDAATVAPTRSRMADLGCVADEQKGLVAVFNCPSCGDPLPRPVEIDEFDGDREALKRAEWDYPVVQDAALPVRIPAGWRTAREFGPGLDRDLRDELDGHHTQTIIRSLATSSWRNTGIDPGNPSRDAPTRDLVGLRAAIKESKRLKWQRLAAPSRVERPLTVRLRPDPLLADYPRTRSSERTLGQQAPHAKPPGRAGPSLW